jgi:hypothetical protein
MWQKRIFVENETQLLGFASSCLRGPWPACGVKETVGIVACMPGRLKKQPAIIIKKPQK